MHVLTNTIAEFPLGCAGNWQTAEQQQLTPAQADWLLDPQSLTAKLKALSQQFRVSLLGSNRPLFCPTSRNGWMTMLPEPCVKLFCGAIKSPGYLPAAYFHSQLCTMNS